MDDQALLRFSRHILLDEIGIEGQQKLLAARVLIVGMGGLGAPAALYLAAAGVGHLVLADGDSVDLTNLQRQIVHAFSSVGMNKARSAAQTLLSLDPAIELDILPTRLADHLLAEEVAKADVVLDCSDNFATRHAINAACVRYARPLVSGAAISFSGQLSVFDLREPANPCYHCLFPNEGSAGGQNCATFGVLSPLVGVIGSLQAAETIKLICGIGSPLVGRLQMLDMLGADWQTLRYQKDPSCPVCAAR